MSETDTTRAQDNNDDKLSFQARKLLADLQLPSSNKNNTVRLLIVADVHLSSASQLAEELLHHNDTIHGVVVGGPLSRPSDIQAILSKNKSNNNHNHAEEVRDRPELTAALQGLYTATLSQLETIVCRVVYCDPNLPNIRYTPNAQSVSKKHHTSLRLLPGLNIVGQTTRTSESNNETTTDASQLIVISVPKLSAGANDSTSSWDGDDADEFFESFQSGLDVSSSSLDQRTTAITNVLLHIWCHSEQSPPSMDDNVLRPGSLRSSGDYTLVDLCPVVVEGEGFRWTIQAVDCRQLSGSRLNI